MYHNYGKMCKITAIVLFWLLAIAGVGSGSVMILMGTVGDELFMWLGLAASVSGVGLAWLSSIALYTIGDIWEKLHAREQLTGGAPAQMPLPVQQQYAALPEPPDPVYIAELRVLKAQLDAQEITEEEFNQKKQEILDTMQ